MDIRVPEVDQKAREEKNNQLHTSDKSPGKVSAQINVPSADLNSKPGKNG